jgi:hypothetical protein
VRSSHQVLEPLLFSQDTEDRPYPPLKQSRLRPKTKPESIFIHPTESNVFRADAAALELGITSNTEFAMGNNHQLEAREHGKREDIDQEGLGSSSRPKFPS